MPRTFSLKRLLIGVTALCVGLGIVINFPEQSLGIGWRLGFFAPAIIVSLVLSTFSSRPRTTIAGGLVGASIGFLYIPAIRALGRDAETYWDFFLIYYLLMAIPPAVGALLAAGVLALACPRPRKTATV